MPDKRKSRDTSLEQDPQLEGDEQAQLDELGDDPAEVGARSAGQSGSSQGLSEVADANEESVEELADTDQAFESAAVDGVEDAADHPERPVHTHEEYGRPDDVPPGRKTPSSYLREEEAMWGQPPSAVRSSEARRLTTQTNSKMPRSVYQITTASLYSPNTRRIASEISPTVA